ncbi:MAG TPA: chromate transporter [Casimicrobiaceae bacterium]|nr:chromate transporter [Casimicrobiaceae bacterium]
MNDPFEGTAPASVGADELFFGFLKVGLSGFGGVLPFARRMLVEERAWLTEREFTELLSLSQFLPGPNVVNLSIIVGNRFRGPLGSLAALFGLMLMPFLIVLALAALYARFAEFEAVRGATAGVSSAATGLIIATGLKMARPLSAVHWQIPVAALAFVALAIVRVPLLWALLALVPISVALAWRTRQ